MDNGDDVGMKEEEKKPMMHAAISTKKDDDDDRFTFASGSSMYDVCGEVEFWIRKEITYRICRKNKMENARPEEQQCINAGHWSILLNGAPFLGALRCAPLRHTARTHPANMEIDDEWE